MKGALVRLVFGATIMFGAGCAASLYGAELTRCVNEASSLQESQACRCAVNKRYGRPCNPEVSLDGGSDGGS